MNLLKLDDGNRRTQEKIDVSRLLIEVFDLSSILSILEFEFAGEIYSLKILVEAEDSMSLYLFNAKDVEGLSNSLEIVAVGVKTQGTMVEGTEALKG
uniref:Uncharacterized protein n=1 Tax=Nelumbo nucifera TaxID=4432 RepID=A0A822ZDB5_NELNU|nr:TPA_asm: hypothetical protein HUJ06_001117 [Nelumbo nucifera]